MSQIDKNKDDKRDEDEEGKRINEGGIEPEGGRRADPQGEPGGPPPWYQPESGQPGPREPPPEIGDDSDD